MFDTRFRPPQEAIDWDESGQPLIAGVNAFGFGGINAHAILTAHEPKSGKSKAPVTVPFYGRAILASATDRDKLIEKLTEQDFSDTGGEYRIVIFDPDDKRLQQAIEIVEKDAPWYGRLDIWFSNRSLLQEGKTAFMIPGLLIEQDPEADSLSLTLDLPKIDDTIADYEKEGITRREGIKPFLVEELFIKGLSHFGIEPDLYFGHSVGEWNAAALSGLTGGNWDEIASEMDPWKVDIEFPIVAVSGAGIEEAEAWCKQIPDLHVANDNCPSQVALSGTVKATDQLRALLDERKLFYAVLDHGSGIHTPFIKKSLDSMTKMMKKVNVQKGHVPVWSAATLEEMPTEKQPYLEVSNKQLTQRVRFRELTEKLYEEEGVRFFIQVGAGSLVAFVEDTLKGRGFAAISCNLPNRDGADQLRRILALAFALGKTDADPNLIGVSPIYQSTRGLLRVHSSPLNIQEMPGLVKIMQEHYGAGGVGASVIGLEVPPTLAGNPLMRFASENLREAVAVQNELVRAFGESGMASSAQTSAVPPSPVPASASAVRASASRASASPVAEKSAEPAAMKVGDSFEEKLRLRFEDHPYLIDHAIIRQPPGWPVKEELNPVVPFAMTIEIFAERAMKYMPGNRL
jgi:hypothetical protein